MLVWIAGDCAWVVSLTHDSQLKHVVTNAVELNRVCWDQRAGQALGGSIAGPGSVIASGMLFVNSSCNTVFLWSVQSRRDLD